MNTLPFTVALNDRAETGKIHLRILGAKQEPPEFQEHDLPD